MTEPATIAGNGATSAAGPERMRAVVADYIASVHMAYVRQARTLPPATQGRMPLLSGATLHVAAAGTRHLHVIGTWQRLGGGQRGAAATVDGETDGLHWTLAFFDPVIVPALGRVDESGGPAFDEVRRVLGIGAHVYHLTLAPSSGLTLHHAEHTGTGLANAHATAARELDTLARLVGPDREWLARELDGALGAGLPRAAALLARALAPDDDTVLALAARAEAGVAPDPAELRRTVLAAVRRREPDSGDPR